MLELPNPVALFSVTENVEVHATLVRLTRELAATQIDGAWWNLPVSRTLRENEDDHHWSWRKIVGEHRNDRAWEAIAVQGPGGAVEGAMVYRIDAKSQLEAGQGAIFIDRIATAPRSRPWLVPTPQFRGVGSILLLAAVRHSYFLGLGGRAWLVSLPGERTRQFYVRRGFEMVFEDEDGMIGYELPAVRAVAWLEAEGCL